MIERRGGVKVKGIAVVLRLVGEAEVIAGLELGAALCVTDGEGEGVAKDKVSDVSGRVGVVVSNPN